MANKRRNTKSKTKKGQKKTYIIIAAIVVVVTLVGALFVIPKLTHRPGPLKVVTVSTLEKVVKTSELSTYETVYNGVHEARNEDKPDKVDYYVAYEATVKAGLDFNEIKLTNDEENKTIVVSLPPITLQDPVVTIENLDYIIVNKKVNQDGLSAKAYKLCIEDAKQEANEQKAIYEYAQQNAEKLIKGLLTPFVDQMEEKYTITFEWRES